MPNWAYGPIKISGTKANVLAFSKHFLCEGEEDTARIDPGVTIFYRSFTWMRRNKFEEQLLTCFAGVKDGEEATASMSADFAWSAHTCLIDHGDDDRCISLPKACMTHQVDVTIQTEELGMCFEESCK